MSKESDKPRVVLAVTETSSLPEMWQALVDHLAGAPAELVTIFVSDDRWRRAASLPFTREISRFSGSTEDFTLQRAEQVDMEFLSRAQLEIERLASDANLQTAFETLSEHNTQPVHELLVVERDVLIAPASIAGRPIYAELVRLNCRIVLVETAERSEPRTF